MGNWQWMDHIEALLAIAGTLGSVGTAALAHTLRFSRKIKTTLDRLTTALDYIDSVVRPAMDLVKKELSPNGGTSISDRMRLVTDEITLINLRWRMSLTFAASGVYECDAKGLLTFANQNMCDLFGMNETDMRGKGWLAAVVGDRHQLWTAWEQCVQEQIPYEAVFEIQNPRTGTLVEVRSVASVHRSVDGRVLGFYGKMEKYEPNRPKSAL